MEDKKGNLAIVLSVILAVLLYISGVLFASSLILVFFKIWGVTLPYLKIFLSVLIVTIVKPLLFGGD